MMVKKLFPVVGALAAAMTVSSLGLAGDSDDENDMSCSSDCSQVIERIIVIASSGGGENADFAVDFIDRYGVTSISFYFNDQTGLIDGGIVSEDATRVLGFFSDPGIYTISTYDNAFFDSGTQVVRNPQGPGPQEPLELEPRR
jgi:hypothetical protein